ncbi:MAG: trypsin-like serine protease [Rhodobacteraceae bacterium]|nr:trypsin-like serine protease [Paracoccaceae bacterium]
MLRIIMIVALVVLLGVGGALAFFGAGPLQQAGVLPADAEISARAASLSSSESSRGSSQFSSSSVEGSSSSVAGAEQFSEALQITRGMLAETRKALDTSRQEARAAKEALAQAEARLRAEQQRRPRNATNSTSSSSESTAGSAGGAQGDVSAARAALKAAEAEIARHVAALAKAEQAKAGAVEEAKRYSEAAKKATLRAEKAETALRSASQTGGAAASQSGSAPNSFAPSARDRVPEFEGQPLDLVLAAANATACGRPRGGGLRSQQVFSIVGGRQAAYRAHIEGAAAFANDFPWIASLKIVSTPGDADGVGEISSRCGASIIDREWLLTAAHCLTPESFSYIDVTLGSSDLSNTQALRVQADRAVCHIGFDHKYASLSNDIALIRLPEPLPPSIPSVSLATPEQVYQLGRETRLKSAGWGATITDSNGIPDLASDYLKTVDLSLRDASGTHLFVSDPAGGVQGVCVGDSGGPLSIGADQGARLVGVTSHVQNVDGYQCSTPDYLSVFTNVSLYRDWIEDVKAVCAERSDC